MSQQPDSGFFCEENSSDDDVILKEEFRGVIIKQGCLLKQVRASPPRLLALTRPPNSSVPNGFGFVRPSPRPLDGAGGAGASVA